MRTPSVILGLGVGGSIVLGMMMQHLLRVSSERMQHPVIQEVGRLFAARLDGPVTVQMARGEDGGKTVHVELVPLSGARQLAREVGEFVWRNMHDDDLRRVEVACRDPLGGPPMTMEVPRPFMPWRPGEYDPPKQTKTAPAAATPPPAAATPPTATTPPAGSPATTPAKPPQPAAQPPATRR